MNYSILRRCVKTSNPLLSPRKTSSLFFPLRCEGKNCVRQNSAGKSKFIRPVNRVVKCCRQAATMLLQQIVCAYEIWE